MSNANNKDIWGHGNASPIDNCCNCCCIALRKLLQSGSPTDTNFQTGLGNLTTVAPISDFRPLMGAGWGVPPCSAKKFPLTFCQAVVRSGPGGGGGMVPP